VFGAGKKGATMNIRKHWQKIVLAVAALFWASCGDSESSTAPKVFSILCRDEEL
jgi:hypothetical protein